LTKINILYELEKELPSDDYNKFIKQLSYKKLSSSSEILVFEAPNKFIANFIKTKYTSIIQDICYNIDSIKPSIEIKIAGERRRSKKDILQEQSTLNIPENSILNQSYTFDSFVVGSSNQMAYNASYAVSNNLGNQYNPLFIYGGTGLGKTHLLQAIGNDAIEKNKIVIYVTIEQFMNDFTFSLKNKNMEHFRNKYRKCDLLLIDDIQFLSGKESTQNEFFHTFNELHTAKKQIVLTSDKLPSQIAGLEERLKSRFEWGLTTDIQIPELETKIAIVEKKSELNGITLTKEIVHFIATNLDNSIREIEGLLIKINASADLLGQEIDLGLVKGLLKDQIKEKKK
jgi:chromosomal replication initiator protein